MTGGFAAIVPASLDGVRVDRAVSMLTGISRAAATELVAGGGVSVGGRPVTSRGTALRTGQRLEVDLPEGGPGGLEPEPSVPVALVFASPSLVVVDKAPGQVVHPGAGQEHGTLVAGLVARFPDIAKLAGNPCDALRPGIVHRLDKGTSGLLVVARTAPAYEALADQFRERTVGRRYTALVQGYVQDERGVVDAPIGRSTRTPTKMAVTAAGRPARTSYEVLARFELPGIGGSGRARPATLVACQLETGRTHQIRVHLAAIGHPVAGDERYGIGRRAVLGTLLPPDRLFLHAGSLAVQDPESGERLSWESPLPSDLAAVLTTGD